jgi:uracil-DNA glycosylase
MGTAPYPTAAPFVPKTHSLQRLRAAVPNCKGCPLYKNATQAVFGAGPAGAPVLMVGEQPGNDEDLQGQPFVGPAGKLLDRALEQAGLDRDSVYVTNAVKHFKFEERGKRRIHKKPSAGEVNACRPWLDAEIETVKPRVVVCLGATAAKSILGNKFRLTTERGKAITNDLAAQVVATIHPSAILRIPEQDERHAEFDRLVSDLKTVRGLL